MSRPNRSIPSVTVIPELAYRDVPAAARWLCGAFGFTERLRIFDHRIQLTFGDGAIVVTELGDATTARDHAVMVRVDDVDAHCEHARAFGAEISSEPNTYPFGERQYSAHDLGGHRWTFTESVADVDPEAWGGVLVAPPT
jgi:uncharacterized glyoxalase superfamily protein PhnB